MPKESNKQVEEKSPEVPKGRVYSPLVHGLRIQMSDDSSSYDGMSENGGKEEMLKAEVVLKK